MKRKHFNAIHDILVRMKPTREIMKESYGIGYYAAWKAIGEELRDMCAASNSKFNHDKWEDGLQIK